ncbi:MAG: S9 family peptidase [Phycisphaerales bacterium]
MVALARRVSSAAAYLALVAGAAPLALAAAGGGGGAGGDAKQPESKLISRAILFGNPDKARAQISPDGKQIAFLAPRDGVMNVFVAPVGKLDEAKPITSETKRGIRNYWWAYTNQHIVFTNDLGGDENWKVYAADVSTGAAKDLTPIESIAGPDGKPIMQPNGKPLRPAARIQTISPKSPDVILVGLNDRDPKFHDLYLLNIRTGERTIVLQNDGFANFITDDDFKPVLAAKPRPDGGTDLVKYAGVGERDGGKAPAAKWEPFQTVAFEDNTATRPIDVDKTGTHVYMIDSRDRDTAAIVKVEVATGKATVVADSTKADAAGAVIHPTEKTVQAVGFNHARAEWRVLDAGIKADAEYLKTVADGDFDITSRSLDDSVWTVAYTFDNAPAKTFLYDRTAKHATLLFSNVAALEGQTLAKMHPQMITSRDGLELVSYLTLPPESDTDGDARPEKPLPTVLLVHGGPWARDTWGYAATTQWLANRGYAVLQVNFRGSTGFGKKFVNASTREWAGKMHDDLIDGVNWAVKNKVADATKTAIMGGSYGGYSTLVGLTFTPETFACGVDIVGPSNLSTLLSTVPPYWVAMRDRMALQVGDHRTEEGRAFLATRSPITFVDKITKPLLIGQGANDPRVKQDESDQIVKAMQKKSIPVTYVLYPDEGHGFQRPENRMSFYAVAETFLAEHLGGRSEPIGDDFKGSSITVPTGADGVKGVKEALK